MIKKALFAGFVASTMAMSAHAGTGFYAGVGAGIGGMDTQDFSSNNSPYNSISLRSGVSGRLALGYLTGAGHLNYGLELGATGYPKNTYKIGNFSETYTGYIADLLGVAKYNFSSSEDGFFVVGKAGAAYVNQKFKGSIGGSTVVSSSKSAIKPELAVGVGYNVSKNLAFDVTYNHLFAGKADPAGATLSSATKISSVNTLLVGLTYSFS
jgi:Outer membrane protein beta-barrel domain